MSQILEQLLQSRRVWRGAGRPGSGIGTGFPALDEALPGGGWPPGAIVEIVTADWGLGELRLLLPTMRTMSERGSFIVWVLPPYEPYAPALVSAGVRPEALLTLFPKHQNDALWCAEKLLASDRCGMLLLWPKKLNATAVRRLQLAAEAGESLGIVLRGQHDPLNWDASPAALRIALCAGPGGQLQVETLKARGSSCRSCLALNL